MNLSFFCVLFLFIIASMATMKQTCLRRSLLPGNRLSTAGAVSLSKGHTNIECAKYCVSSAICRSYIYNTVSGYCQLYKIVSATRYETRVKKGDKYYLVDETEGTPLVSNCPEGKGFQLLQNDGPCVKFHMERKTWFEANHTCVSYSPQSRLVVLDNKQKNNLVKAAGKTYKFHTSVWIGLSEYKLKGNQYRWVDGQDVHFSDWSSKNARSWTSKNCVSFYRVDHWRWIRWACTLPSHFVCEIIGAK